MGRGAPFAAALLVLASGCTPLARSRAEANLAASGTHRLVRGLHLPASGGAEGCGAQALAAVLVRSDPAAADAFAAELGWQETGATPVDVLLAARASGAVATIARGTYDDLVAAIARSEPPIVMIDAGPVFPGLLGGIPLAERPHWAVVSGVRTDGDGVLLAAPGGRHHAVGRRDFLRRWSATDRCVIDVRASTP